MKCSKCYNDIPDDSKICPICQNIFASYFEDVKLTKKQKFILNLHKILFFLVFLVVFIFIVLAIMFRYYTKMSRIGDISNLVYDKGSVNYVNDLYISDGRHYKYLLDSNEKEIYDILFTALKNFQGEVVIDLNKYGIKSSQFTANVFKKIRNIISMDHPELIQLGTMSIFGINNSFITIKINYSFSSEFYNNNVLLVSQKLENFKLDTVNMDEFQKVKYVYEWFYNNSILSNKNDVSLYSAYSCLVNTTCNVFGYSKAIQLVLQNIGVNSILAVGSVNYKYYEWNIIKIEDAYYYLDQVLAFGNDDINYAGFLFKDKRYNLYYKELMPNINGKKYLYK